MNTKRLIIDVREPFEFATGHVDGAINIPPAELLNHPAALNDVDKNTEIIVYCRTGNRSNTSIQIMRNMGLTNLTNGINAEHVIKNYLS